MCDAKMDYGYWAELILTRLHIHHKAQNNGKENFGE